MARGKKYNDDIKERAFALAATNNSITAVAKELGIPRTTVKTWLSQQNEEETQTLEALHRQNKERFVEEAWRAIHAGQELLIRRLERAVDSEREMDRLLSEFLICSDQLSEGQIREMQKRFGELKVMDIGKVAVVLGTMYDKQALIAKEATARVEVADVRFEDL